MYIMYKKRTTSQLFYTSPRQFSDANDIRRKLRRRRRRHHPQLSPPQRNISNPQPPPSQTHITLKPTPVLVVFFYLNV